ncbi:ABC transporter permease, partial [Lactobacillus iners]|nr:ABC transporter permease [Lactobacillus iners]
KQNKHYVIIDAYEHPISQSYVIKGKKYNNQSVNGIWINKEYAQHHHLAINDTLKFSVNKRTVLFKVKGIIQNPTR